MRHCLEMGCLGLDILCLCYYIGIVMYAGITTSFAWIWLFGGTALILLRIALWYQRLHPYLWLRVITWIAVALLLTAFLVVLLIGSRVVGAMHTVPQQDLDYVIVLGAQVRGTKPSLSLLKRLERAAEYAEENPDTVLILSGGQGPDEGISEAECMYRYLTEAGISEDRLIREDASTSTRENLVFSSEIIRGLQISDYSGTASVLWAETEAGTTIHGDDSQMVTASVGVLSNDFHIYRALLLAKSVGYTNISGIPADSVLGMQPHNILREICAVLVMRVFSRGY
ncbi:MAG: YdcF family protein [Clostridiales bacterium]|nr:YdcF family protein [Clostridiales bacterium]